MNTTFPRTVTAVLTKPGVWVCRSCFRQSLAVQRRFLHPNKTATAKFTFRRLKVLQTQHSSRTGLLQRRQNHGNAAKGAQEALYRTPVLPNGPARTRFAPSPTGFLHIGGLRTALFSYLLAKRTGGQFLLRIEDTDQKRLVPGAEVRLLEDLRWAGLQWDEGPHVEGPHGPYRQSERNAIYQEHARHLLESGRAYRCFCKPQAGGQGVAAYVTSGCYQDCSSLSRETAQEKAEAGHEDFTVRLKRPADLRKRVYSDLVYGKIIPLKRTLTSVPSEDSESGIDAADTILVKSDGTPTYHFANVVDDHLMEITHVIRGSEWMASTPLHYDLYEAFGWNAPKFAHVGLLVDEHKAKLSKRNSDLALDVRAMREEHGVLPETLVNFLALQGWSNPRRDDRYDLDGLAEVFDMKFTKGNTMVKFDKLWYLQKQHVVRRCGEVQRSGDDKAIRPIIRQIAEEVVRQFPDVRKRLNSDGLLEGYCRDILLADTKSYQNAKQYVERNRYCFDYDPEQVPVAQERYADTHNKMPSGHFSITATILKKVVTNLMTNFDYKQPYRPLPARLSDWTEEDSRRALEAHVANSLSSTMKVDQRIQTVLQHASRKAALLHVVGIPKGIQHTLPFTDEPLDDTETLKLYRDAGATMEQSQVALAAKKVWTSVLMRYLRERLSYGLPGPSVGMMMAILGYEECCRRLDVTVREGKGW